jgi:hypothetical protein
MEIAERAREIYLAAHPGTVAEPWAKLSAEERHVWIPYAAAAHEAAGVLINDERDRVAACLV